jgi:hypothetical protein
LVAAFTQAPTARRQGNERACFPSQSITASSTSRLNGAVSIGFQSIMISSTRKTDGPYLRQTVTGGIEIDQCDGDEIAFRAERLLSMMNCRIWWQRSEQVTTDPYNLIACRQRVVVAARWSFINFA